MAKGIKTSNGLSLRLLQIILRNQLLVMSRKIAKNGHIFYPNVAKVEDAPYPRRPRVRL